MRNAIFYHAACSVCNNAEQSLLVVLDRHKFKIESVHLGEQKTRIPEAEAAGVKSVPALVLEDQVFHINFGAALADLK
ncbi:MAG: conjugal transfer protein TraF [Methylococcales bacterium]|nr:conjugal transfer protein TraF [Methylococcales bacterium]